VERQRDSGAAEEVQEAGEAVVAAGTAAKTFSKSLLKNRFTSFGKETDEQSVEEQRAEPSGMW
jgi:hypothetical protein